MSDELDFFGVEDPQPSNEPVNEPPAPEPPAIDPAKVQELEAKLQAQEKWQQDFKRFFTGEQQQQPQSVLEDFLKDPNSVLERTAQQAAEMAREQVRRETYTESLRQKYPEVAKFESVIDWSGPMQQAAQELRQKGVHPSFEATADLAAQRVQQMLQGFATQGQQGEQVKRLAMNLDLSGNSQTTAPVDPSKMSDAEWVAHREKMLRQAQGF